MKPLIAKLIAGAIILAILGGGIRFWVSRQPVTHPPGVLIKGAPIQVNCGTSPLPGVAGYEISPLAKYRIDARVLGSKRYHRDFSDLVPIDVALGWGAMSDTAVLSKLSISQSNRFYFYEWKANPPIPADEIVSHSANHHIIAADSQIRAFIRSLKTGDLVSLQGFLVSATKRNVVWRSSLSRTDSGNGACELFYVTTAQMFDPNHGLVGGESADRTSAEPTTETPSDVRVWYKSLQYKRQNLNLNDPAAVKAFNQEVQRYSAALHGQKPTETPDNSKPIKQQTP